MMLEECLGGELWEVIKTVGCPIPQARHCLKQAGRGVGGGGGVGRGGEGWGEGIRVLGGFGRLGWG